MTIKKQTLLLLLSFVILIAAQDLKAIGKFSDVDDEVDESLIGFGNEDEQEGEEMKQSLVTLLKSGSKVVAQKTSRAYQLSNEAEHAIRDFIRLIYQTIQEHYHSDYKNGSKLVNSILNEINPKLAAKEAVFATAQEKTNEAAEEIRSLDSVADDLSKAQSKANTAKVIKSAAGEIADSFKREAAKAEKFAGSTKALVKEVAKMSSSSVDKIKKVIKKYLDEQKDKVEKYTHLSGGIKDVTKGNTAALRDLIDMEVDETIGNLTGGTKKSEDDDEVDADDGRDDEKIDDEDDVDADDGRDDEKKDKKDDEVDETEQQKLQDKVNEKYNTPEELLNHGKDKISTKSETAYKMAKDAEHIMRDFLNDSYNELAAYYSGSSASDGKKFAQGLSAIIDRIIDSEEETYLSARIATKDAASYLTKAVTSVTKDLNLGVGTDVTTTNSESQAAYNEIINACETEIHKTQKFVTETKLLQSEINKQQSSSVTELKKIMAAFLSSQKAKVMKYTNLETGIKSVAKDAISTTEQNVQGLISTVWSGLDIEPEQGGKVKDPNHIKKDQIEPQQTEPMKEKDPNHVKKDQIEPQQTEPMKEKDPNHIKKDQIEPQQTEPMKEKDPNHIKKDQQEAQMIEPTRLFQRFFK